MYILADIKEIVEFKIYIGTKTTFFQIQNFFYCLM